MKIGILTRFNTSNTNVKINGIPITYLNTIKEKCYPIFIDSTIPLETHQDNLLDQIKDLDAFILPGGDTISDIDLFVIDYCYKNDIPLLGICLGMQEIAIYFDNNCLSPIGNLSHFDMNKKYLHDIKFTPNGYFSTLLKKDKISVNSRHKYHIKENPSYTIEAKSENIIEAIKVKNKKYIVGVQFHPEIMYEYDFNARLIFQDFMNHIQK